MRRSWAGLWGALLSLALWPPASSAPESCVSNCLQLFISTSGTAAFGKATTIDKLSWKEILEISAQADSGNGVMEEKFDAICQTYASLKTCLGQCRASPVQGTIIRGFASLEYICFQEKDRFLAHLPCLAQFEYKVMLHCQHETNQTLVATQALQQAAYNNDLSQLRWLLESLCTNTSRIIECMTPETERYCGPAPASMLKHLVALSFNNIETLYQHMGLEAQLPASCRALGRLSQQRPNVHLPQKPHREGQPTYSLPGQLATSGAAGLPAAATVLLALLPSLPHLLALLFSTRSWQL